MITPLSTSWVFLSLLLSSRVLPRKSKINTPWPMLRLAPFPKAESYFVGVACCSPKRGGLAIDFSEFIVTLPQRKDLHDLT
jgi:regulation of enolase protein 1 (concanavalin A-like superfamily)